MYEDAFEKQRCHLGGGAEVFPDVKLRAVWYITVGFLVASASDELKAFLDDGRNTPLRPLTENDMLVKFHAWSVNYPKLAIANGSYPWLPENPAAIPGSDAAGEIIATGSNAKRFSAGDRAFPVYYDIPGLDTPGVFCEYAVFNKRALARAPSNLSYEESASLVCSRLTAWNALYGCNPINPRSWVLVQGTGGVSMFAIQFALAAGATVIGTTSSDTKTKLLKDLGVHYVLNHKQDVN